jgi:MscS family membrane protein
MVDRIMAYLQAEWLRYSAAWAVFGGYIVATWLVGWLGRWLMRWLIARITVRTHSTLDDQMIRAATGPVRLTVWAIGVNAALLALQSRIPSLAAATGYKTEFDWVLKIVGAVVILAVTALTNALLKAALDWYLHDIARGNRVAWDEELLPVIRRVMSLLLYFIAVSIILKSKFDQDITALVTTAGVASLAVALAAQETLSNMLGGFVILVDRPFKVGDVIELADGKSGEVMEIGLRSTRIKQFDGTALVVPNRDMANSRIVNYAQPNPMAAIRQTIGVGYGTDIEKAKHLLLGVMETHPGVLQEPAPGVWFTKFGACSLDLFMSCWVASYKDRFRVTDELNVRILKAFREAGIDIPFPQQDVHLYVEDRGGPEADVAPTRVASKGNDR